MLDERLKKMLQKHKAKLGLEDYLIDVFVTDDKHLISDKQNQIEHKETDYLALIINRDYDLKEFSIVINKKAMKGDIENTLCHELLHILFWGQSDLLENIINLFDLTEEQKEKFLSKMSMREHDTIERLLKIII